MTHISANIAAVMHHRTILEIVEQRAVTAAKIMYADSASLCDFVEDLAKQVIAPLLPLGVAPVYALRTGPMPLQPLLIDLYDRR